MELRLQIVNDLILIHEELMTECRQTALQFDDGSLLRILFVRLELESGTLKSELIQRLPDNSRQHNKGKIHKIWEVWIRTHIISTTKKNNDLLSYFQVLEEAVVKSYQASLYSYAVPDEIRELLKKQLKLLQNSAGILNRFQVETGFNTYS